MARRGIPDNVVRAGAAIAEAGRRASAHKAGPRGAVSDRGSAVTLVRRDRVGGVKPLWAKSPTASALAHARREDEGTISQIALPPRSMAISSSWRSPSNAISSEAVSECDPLQRRGWPLQPDPDSNRAHCHDRGCWRAKDAGTPHSRLRRRSPAETAGISPTRRRRRKPCAGTEERKSAIASLSDPHLGRSKLRCGWGCDMISWSRDAPEANLDNDGRCPDIRSVQRQEGRP